MSEHGETRLRAIALSKVTTSGLATGKMPSALSFELGPTDAATPAVVAGVILSVAAIWSFVPARLARRIGPIIAQLDGL